MSCKMMVERKLLEGLALSDPPRDRRERGVKTSAAVVEMAMTSDGTLFLHPHDSYRSGRT